jgi:hypothetical protein
MARIPSPDPVSPDTHGSRLELGIFLASFAVLLLELLLTRIFSVTMFHHFAFFAVALAMTGLGAGGLALTIWPERFPRERLPVLAGVSALVFALATMLVVSLAFHLPVSLQLRDTGFRNALLVFVAAVVPFVAAGLILALLLTHHPQRVARLYGWDLLGAASACAVVAPAITLLGAPTAVLLAAAVGALSGAVLAFPVAQVCAVPVCWSLGCSRSWAGRTRSGGSTTCASPRGGRRSPRSSRAGTHTPGWR